MAIWSDKILMAKAQNKRDSKFLILSLLVHALILVLFHVHQTPPPPPQVVKVEVEYLTPEPQPEQIDTVKTERALPDQIVEQDKRINDEKDKDSRFLSEFDQKVLKETRADRAGKFKNTNKGGRPDEGQKDGEKKEEMETEKTVKRERAPGELPDLKDLSPKFALIPGPKAMVFDENGDPSENDDYLKDVQSGLQTLLSTREFVYYSYYNRIKDALRQHWEPNVREKVKIIYRKGRSIASAKDRVTQVLVTLDAKGELIKVEVITHSGVEALDAAAVEAFQNAAPFPNPPQGMKEKDGTIKIRWDFVLEARLEMENESHFT
jgi:protein TonB